MTRYDLPILISEREGTYSIALAVSDSVVVSRQISRADLQQLHARLANMFDRAPAGEDD
ncbi:MAG: hypothetical protein HOH66_17855 [Rhodospirillaceae bacterium]|jgi:hypothetical protein|nr:hypothetical protein [Rhodospirillaceae bacterium]